MRKEIKGIRMIRGCGVDENEGLWWVVRRDYMFGVFFASCFVKRTAASNSIPQHIPVRELIRTRPNLDGSLKCQSMLSPHRDACTVQYHSTTLDEVNLRFNTNIKLHCILENFQIPYSITLSSNFKGFAVLKRLDMNQA